MTKYKGPNYTNDDYDARFVFAVKLKKCRLIEQFKCSIEMHHF